MSVLDPRELEASPLADLHALAAELGLEGFRLLRREELIAQIVAAQGGAPVVEDERAEAPAPERPRADAAAVAEPEVAAEEAQEPVAEEREAEEPAIEQREPAEPEPDEELRSGILDILPNGSGFIRAEPYRQSREDVYVSPAQIRRCELRPGDEVAGPVRPPRRNERHPSLVRVATVNGQDADQPSERPRFEALTATWPTQRLAGPHALADLPFGKGSRVAIAGPPGAGATSLLRATVKALRERHPDLELIVVLAGVRPEEAPDWRELGVELAGGSFDASLDEQAQVAELAVQRAQRRAEAGRDAVVVVDALDVLPQSTARRVFGAGRNTQEAGSVTVLAATGVAAEPHRMATTHVTLEPGDGGEPRIGAGSGTLRRELLA